jgi:integrase
MAVLLLTGMRQGELLGLRWKDIDFTSKLIHKRNVVYRGKLVEGLKQTRRTGRARVHEIGMSDIVEGILRFHREHGGRTLFNGPDHFVFCRSDGRALDPDHIRRYVLYPAMEKAGIEVIAHESGLHMFRHTVVSVVAARVGLKQAQDQAGHADIATTANVYTHVDVAQKLTSANALRDAFAAQLLSTVSTAQLSTTN